MRKSGDTRFLDPAKVMISILARSAPALEPENEDEISMLVEGSFALTADGRGGRLNYTEADPDDSGSTEVEILVLPEGITMSRRGDWGASMVFERGKVFKGMYRTPYGNLSMDVFTTFFRAELGEAGGKIELRYQMEIEGHIPVVHSLLIGYAGDRAE